METIYILDDKATFVCPKCEKAKTADVSKYKFVDAEIKVNCKCPCGHRYTVLLDRRQ